MMMTRLTKGAASPRRGQLFDEGGLRMPEFANPFAGKIPDRKLNAGELVRAIRLDLAAEQEAVNQYLAQADAADNPLAAKVLADIANEERTHAGEFLRLLQLLTGDEDTFLKDGAAEVDAVVAASAAPKPVEAAAPAVEEKPAPSIDGSAEPTLGSLKE
jgi:uncharacterized protein